MKNPIKLQEKLVHLLRGTPALKVFPNYERPWNDMEFREVAWIVQDFINQNPEVGGYDSLRDWLDEYYFLRADTRTM